MTYEKTLRELKRVLGDVKRPKELDRYTEELLRFRDEVVEEVLSRLNLPDDKKTYAGEVLKEFYTSLISGGVENFWKGRYEGSYENVRRDISAEVFIFIASEFVSTLTRKVLDVVSKEDAKKLIPYLTSAAVSGLAFVVSARQDMEYDFLGITSELMDRIRKLGANRG